jgi:GNAT superfamily N-acetyltransferase
MIKVVPFEAKYLVQAKALVDSVFPNEKYPPSEAFEASVDKTKYGSFMERNGGIGTFEYFVAVDENDLVLGTSGLYTESSDCEDSYWIGWYCVHKDHRGKKIGKLLLEYTINEARRRGKKFLKLYTSTSPDEAAAQKIYEKNDFYITDAPRVKQGKYEIFYRKKEL